MRKLAALLVCMTAVSASASAERGIGMPEEIRAFWVARWELSSPEACNKLIRTSTEYGFNALVVQVRGRGDALYNAAYEPRSELLDGQPADFDPLGLLVDEGHKAGLQIHAWINANYTWGSAELPKSPEHIVNKHPDWLMRTNENVVNMTGGDDVEGAYTCPSSDDFREHLKSIYLDVVNKYDVDGVHFDFIRYPSTRFCYCDRCLSKFGDEIAGRLKPEERIAVSNLPERNAITFAFPKAWDDFRRSQINKLVYTVYDAVKKAKPRIVVSAAVFPNYYDAYNHRFQDWKQWMKDGKIDLLCPMAYAKTTETFAKDIKDAVDSSNGVPVCAGIGSWQIPAESTVEKIRKARELKTAGFCLFAYSAGKEEYWKTLRENAMK